MVAVTAHLSLWMLATLVTIVRTGQMYEKATLIRDLNLEIQSAPPGTKLVIMDIGSNDGTWTAEMVMPIVRSALRKGLAPHAYIVEPQPNFREHLSRLAQQMGAHATFISAAAWKENTTLSFAEQHGSKSATLLTEPKDWRVGSGRVNHIAAIDVAELVKRAPRPNDDGGRVITLLKIDVEGMSSVRPAPADPSRPQPRSRAAAPRLPTRLAPTCVARPTHTHRRRVHSAPLDAAERRPLWRELLADRVAPGHLHRAGAATRRAGAASGV